MRGRGSGRTDGGAVRLLEVMIPVFYGCFFPSSSGSEGYGHAYTGILGIGMALGWHSSRHDGLRYRASVGSVLAFGVSGSLVVSSHARYGRALMRG